MVCSCVGGKKGVRGKSLRDDVRGLRVVGYYFYHF